MIELQPSADKPLPFDLSDEQPKTHADSIAIAANTVDLVERLGASLDFDAKDFQAAAALATGKTKPNVPTTDDHHVLDVQHEGSVTPAGRARKETRATEKRAPSM